MQKFATGATEKLLMNPIATITAPSSDRLIVACLPLGRILKWMFQLSFSSRSAIFSDGLSATRVVNKRKRKYGMHRLQRALLRISIVGSGSEPLIGIRDLSPGQVHGEALQPIALYYRRFHMHSLWLAAKRFLKVKSPHNLNARIILYFIAFLPSAISNLEGNKHTLEKMDTKFRKLGDWIQRANRHGNQKD